MISSAPGDDVMFIRPIFVVVVFVVFDEVPEPVGPVVPDVEQGDDVDTESTVHACPELQLTALAHEPLEHWRVVVLLAQIYEPPATIVATPLEVS